MGLFGGIFGSSKEDERNDVSTIPWKTLNSMDQLVEIKIESSKIPQVIFKHSTSCGISRMVLNMFKSGYKLEVGQMDFYFLDLHSNRDVSNAVATEFGITHQSPQLLIVKNGVVVFNDSHGAIGDVRLENYL